MKAVRGGWVIIKLVTTACVILAHSKFHATNVTTRIFQKRTIIISRSPGVNKRRPKGQFFDMAANVNLGDVQIPKTYNEAIESRFEERWRAAMLKEITDLWRNKTWALVDRDQVPAGKRITKSRWVYDLKYLRDGTIERFKARFVACGYSQVYGPIQSKH